MSNHQYGDNEYPEVAEMLGIDLDLYTQRNKEMREQYQKLLPNLTTQSLSFKEARALSMEPAPCHAFYFSAIANVTLKPGWYVV